MRRRRRRRTKRGGDPQTSSSHFPAKLRRLMAPQEAYQEVGQTEDDPDTDESYGPGIENGYESDLAVCAGDKLLRPAKEGRDAGTHGEAIAPICKTRLDLDRLVEMDTAGELDGVIDLIREPRVFENALLPGAREAFRRHRKVSRHMLQHLDDLEGFGVLKEADAAAYLTLPAFTVSKKSGGLRFIVDARPLNKHMVRPPDMRLDDIIELRTTFPAELTLNTTKIEGL